MAGARALKNTPRDKKYNAIKLRLTIAGIIIDLILIALLAFSGISSLAAGVIGEWVSNQYAAFLIFIAAAGIVFSAVGLPMDYYGGYHIEHRFNLSNQTFWLWMLDKAENTAVGACIGIPVALAFYYFLKTTGHLWWIYFSIFIFVVTVLLARVAPIVIYPFFYTFKKLEPGEIRDTIAALVEREGIRVSGIFSFNLSKDTKKANAGFTGLGGSKRIILSDTLIERFTPAEIGAVFAHELGHYKKRHIAKGILLSTFIIFLSFFLCGWAYRFTLSTRGFEHAHDIAAIPVLFFYLTIVGLVSMPLSNAVSRYFEREADRYSVGVTGDPGAFISAMNRLADMNLADRDPNPVTEFMFYSHPSIQKRIAFAEDRKHPGT